MTFGLLAAASGAAAEAEDAPDCAQRTGVAVLNGHLADAEAAYAALDPEAYEASVQAATAALTCLDDVVPVEVAARYHRIEALKQYAVPDEDAVKHALRAARVLDPDGGFPEDVLPPDHELRARHGQTPAEDAGGESVPTPADGQLYFDGASANQRPGRATIFQLVVDAVPSQTAYLYPADPLPPYAVLDTSAGTTAPGSTTRTRRPARTVLWSLAGAALAGSAATYGAAWSTNARFYDEGTTSADELRSLQRQSWTLSGVSVGLLVVGAGTGVGGWVAR